MQTVPEGTPSRPRPRWRSVARVGVLAAAAVVAVLVLVARLAGAQHAVQSAAQQRGMGGAPAGPQRGQVAPDFALHSWAWWDDALGARAQSDQTTQLVALRGRPVVLNFWASWCVPCREEAPALAAAWRRYEPQGVAFVGVDIEDTAADSGAFVKQYGVAYLTGPDMTETIAVKYAVPSIPTTVFIDRRGVIAGRVQGALDAATLDRSIQAMLGT